MIPIIGAVGWHRTGKTTFIVGLIRVLRARGIRVATIKHTSEAIQMDREGTDTFHFAQAGSSFVAIAGRQGSAVLLPQPPEPTFWELAAMVPANIDLIIVEGYRKLNLPRFEILIEGLPETPPELLLAAVYRDLALAPAGLFPDIPILQASEYERAVDILLEKGILAL
ncbi:MAG: molybdopterin-guanine dinucleotide biosynthesis protein B [Chloroflexi bacterium]|nr:molybdopterin-guanine dinucleotide biosynthesis protein B [Chloroflexota bacterium]